MLENLIDELTKILQVCKNSKALRHAKDKQRLVLLA